MTTLVTFGDSVTWYDQQQFLPVTYVAGERVVGYQSYLRQDLGLSVINAGVSGETTAEICARALAFDYSTVDAATFLCGINDFNKDYPENIGRVVPTGTVAEANTFCGALQTAIEDAKRRAPQVKLGLIAPFPVARRGEFMPAVYRDCLQDIASQYGVPLLDLYALAPIDAHDPRDFADNPDRVTFYFHPNNGGYAKLAMVVTPFVQKIISEQ